MTGTKTRAKWIGGLLAGCLLLLAPEWAVQAAEDSPTPPAPINPWPNLVQQADALGLPTRFLKEIDPDFVKVEFEDLHTYAAEYHPEHHRMILNLRLSFNKAGGALTDLKKMTHHDLSLLYHELLHAYLDYLFSAQNPDTLTPEAKRVLGLANEQLRCRYRFIRINPIRQRREVTELRFLSKEDAWEVLNETWGVFVGWAVWTKLELYRTPESVGQWTAPLMDEWAQRLAAANQSGELLGYYEPDDPEERRETRKRYVAPSNGITPEGTKLLLELVLEEPQELVNRSGKVIEATQNTSAEPLPCN